jgi:hypothetical protein
LPRTELTVERFATWIALNDRLDGLAWGVARRVEGPIQVQVQVLTSLVEGLHRRRKQYGQSKFPDATGGALDRIKKAARRGAVDKSSSEKKLDPEKVRKAVMAAVSRMEDVDYVERAEAVIAEVCSVVPEIAESVADLPSRLTKARNDFAHQLEQDEAREPFAERVLRWLVVTNVTSWLLRGLLLLWAGVEPEVLHARFLDSQRFGFFRANTAQHVRELGWELPSDEPEPEDPT